MKAQIPFQTPFQTRTLLNNRHLQTIWPTLFRNLLPLERMRETLHWPDGDFIHIDWYGTNDQSPLVVLLHGLTGSSESSYILGLQKQLLNFGWQSLAVNFRGCSGEPNLLPRSYHSGDSQELSALLQALRKRFPQRQLAAVGYSLGGNILLKYQGEQGKNSLLDCAVAVSPPFMLDLCACRMNQGVSKIYRNRFIRRMRQQLEAKRAFFARQQWYDHLAPLDAIGNLDRIKTFQEYDHRVTAPLHGFTSAEEYYRQSSCRFYLKGIATPTLIIHSKDDPFMTDKVIPMATELSESTCLELCDKGGHVGFISGTFQQQDYWLESRIPLFLADHFNGVTEATENNKTAPES
ncbi:MAG: hydrolase [Endozoicomonas sp.]